jgi:hypothetical protein
MSDQLIPDNEFVDAEIEFDVDVDSLTETDE